MADFCMQLALGLVGCLLLLSPERSARPTVGRKALVNANFFKTLFLVGLGLSVGAILWLLPGIGPGLLVSLAVAAGLCLAGSVSWSLERSPGGVSLIVGSLAALVTAVVWRQGEVGWGLLGSLSAAALLGAATGAMLLGHNYLIAPTMSMVPLFRLLVALGVALGLRAGLDGYALLRWTTEYSLANLNGDLVLWLPLRWLVGLVAPAVLLVLVWQTARIRSTQSATGILYVVVVFCFLGELTGQLLRPAGLAM